MIPVCCLNLIHQTKLSHNQTIEGSCQQLIPYLEEYKQLPKDHSAYHRHHSTETVLLRILSDVSEAADNGKVTSLVLLDLSLAFDCVDHNILLGRIEQRFGVHDQVLSWIKAYLTNRSSWVRYRGTMTGCRKMHARYHMARS